MKKLLSLIMAAAMLLSLAACGGAPAETTPPTTEAPVETTEAPIETTEAADKVYTYSETNGFGLAVDWTLKLKEDGTYVLSEKNEIVGEESYEGTSYTVDGNTVVCDAMVSGPGLFEWANPEGFTVTIDGDTFAPVVENAEAEAGVTAGTYTYSEENQFGLAVAWTLKLNEDGTYVLSEKNEIVGEKSYEGTSYTVDGNTVICGAMVSGPDLFDWANPEGFTATIDGDTFAPVVESAESVIAGTYTYSEENQFGLAVAWTLKLNEDGTYILSEKNEIVGEKSYEGTSYTVDGNTVICGAMVSGPDLFDWANPEGFTVTIEGETFTPVV